MDAKAFPVISDAKVGFTINVVKALAHRTRQCLSRGKKITNWILAFTHNEIIYPSFLKK